MDANAVYAEIKQTLGIVPSFLKAVPKDEIESEWQLFKHVEFDEGAIPNKYRELIGLGIAAATKCWYCALFHTEAARIFGATDQEIESTIRYAKNSAGWSTYLNGLQFDHDAFKKEVAEMSAYLRAHAGKMMPKPGDGRHAPRA